ncbi:MAG TPA: glycosyltransferase family 1 protein, partial [Nitrospina sp.]|nr:glycosyltransferase family 1 protein [Nitrospina sp.]
MKKIFHISGTTIPGGGPEHIFQLIKRLNQNEWEVAICTLKDGLYWEKFKSLNIKTYNLALRIISLKTACKFFLILRKEKPDLIHTHGKGPGLYGRLIGSFLNIPVIHTFHGFHYQDIPFPTRWFHLAAETFLSLFTDQHIFVSTGEKNRARVLKFLDEENSTVIHNGVDHEHIDSLATTRNKALKLSGTENWEKNKILGTISRLSPEKGILCLLAAFSIAIKEIPDPRLIIIGGYPEEHNDYYLKVKSLIDKENLTDYVRILGYRQDTVKILKCFDFYISSSLSEGLPMSMLEAFASGIPTIATEIAGNKDILCNSTFGVLAEPGSPESLYKGIIKMVHLTQDERDFFSRNGSNRIKTHFSIDEM